MQKQLRAYFKRSGTNQNQLANTLGVHRSVVNHWMKGICKPAKGRIFQVADITGIKIEDLL
jgi:transcriptional regulator with XRE-family HTH domain